MLNVRRQIVIGALIALPIGGAALYAQAKTAPAAPPSAQGTKTATAPAVAGRVSSPKDVWGHNVGDDYFLANYKQEYDYFNLLAKQSNRIHITDIGKSSEGRPMITAIVTSAANYPKLARYKEISRRLSLNEVKDDAEARALAKEGKAIKVPITNSRRRSRMEDILLDGLTIAETARYTVPEAGVLQNAVDYLSGLLQSDHGVAQLDDVDRFRYHLSRHQDGIRIRRRCPACRHVRCVERCSQF